MLWEDYYDGFWDWAESTRRARIYTLEDIGPGDEVAELACELQDAKDRARLLRKAMELGAEFSADDISLLDGYLPADTYLQLCSYSNADPDDPYCAAESNPWEETEEMLPEDTEKCEKPASRPRRPGLLATVLMALVLSAKQTRRKDRGRCDGNCSRCPSHYGYRYGRWYYGHGHMHGCQRGGNGGANGRIYRN